MALGGSDDACAGTELEPDVAPPALEVEIVALDGI